LFVPAQRKKENAMESTTRLHPLLSAAAISVIALSVAGIGVFTGLMPKSISSTQYAAPVPAVTAAAPEHAAVPAPVPAPAAKPKPVKKAAVRAAAPEPARDYAQDEFMRGQSARQPHAPVVLTQAPQPPLAQAPSVQPKCLDCGTVEAVREIEQKGEGSWIGPVAGGVGGAILGKQMGKGKGNTIMTILGAAGGAYAGNEIEKRVRTTKRWEVSVRLDDGSVRSVSYDAAPAWRGGERVRYVNGAIMPEQRT
jgi:outer membrane lipoprotein SlyB